MKFVKKALVAYPLETYHHLNQEIAYNYKKGNSMFKKHIFVCFLFDLFLTLCFLLTILSI